MPHPSDAMYSADDAETRSMADSFSNELSPTDGYFNASSPLVPRDVVSDPSVEQEHASEVKALEAKLEKEANFKYPSSMVAALGSPLQRNPPAPVASSSSRPFPPPSATSASIETSVRPPTSEASNSRPALWSSSVSRQDTSVSSATSESSHHPTPINFASSRANFFDHSAPPPTYAAAIASPVDRSPSSPQQPFHNYQTFSEQPTPTSPVPESMGTPGEYHEPTESEYLIPKPPPKRRFISRTTVKNTLLTLLALSLIIGFLTSTFIDDHSTEKGRPKMPSGDGRPGMKDPSFSPPLTSLPYCPHAKIKLYEGKPVVWEIPVDPGHEFSMAHTLSEQKYRNSQSIHTTGEIRVRHLYPDESHGKGFVTMDIRVSDEQILPEIKLDSDTATLKIVTPQYGVFSDHRTHCMSLEITIWLPATTSLDRFAIFSSSLNLNLYEDLDVHVKEAVVLQTISGSIRLPTFNSLDPYFGPDFQYLSSNGDLDASERRTIEQSALQVNKIGGRSDGLMAEASADNHEISPYKTTTSIINAPAFLISSISGNVRGSFHLYDNLSIETISGSIDVTVTPHHANDSDHLEARTVIDSKSGSIKAYFPIHHPDKQVRKLPIPYREYYTSISTISGSVHGSFIVGFESKISSESGNTKTSLLPLENNPRPQDLTIRSASASLKTTVLSPYAAGEKDDDLDEYADVQIEDPDWIPIGDDDPYLRLPSGKVPSPANRALRNLMAEIKTTGGSNEVLLPSAYEGVLQASTLSGSLVVDGNGVLIDSQKDVSWAYRGILAHKGDDYKDASVVVVSTLSGSCKIHVNGPDS